MNKKNILLALLAVCLVATGVSIRTFSFAQIDLGDLAIFAGAALTAAGILLDK